jgi:glutathione synthase/RimK-type ligase-like ATP-grasp enzyme
MDTGASIVGFEIPHWRRILNMSAACYEAVGLGYLGVDVVLDRDRGPLILELNARPGLNIQIANRKGLRRRMQRVEREADLGATPEERARWARMHFRD